MQNKYNIKYNIIHLDEVSSTMDEIRKFSHNTVLFVNKQTNARGKSGRVWNAENNNNLYCSINLKADLNYLDYSQLSFLTSISIRDAVKETTNSDINIQTKWPNDLLINNKKFVGILLEFDIQKKNLIIGFGININYFPENTTFKATSLKREGFDIKKENLLEIILKYFDSYFEDWKENGFKKVHDLWLQTAYNFKKEITIRNNQTEDLIGVFEDFNCDGTLILKDKNNQIHEIKSGDVF